MIKEIKNKDKKMIWFKVGFFTDKFPEESNKKTAGGNGVITLLTNKSKDLKSKQTFFNNLEEFTTKFQKLLDENKITLISEKKEHIIKKFK